MFSLIYAWINGWVNTCWDIIRHYILIDWCNPVIYIIQGCFTHHDDVIKWKHFQRYWHFLWGIHRWPVNSSHKGHSRGALMFSLICAWTNGCASNRDAGYLRRHHAHYDVPVMTQGQLCDYPSAIEIILKYIGKTDLRQTTTQRNKNKPCVYFIWCYLLTLSLKTSCKSFMTLWKISCMLTL